jgi:hypothetical protein
MKRETDAMLPRHQEIKHDSIHRFVFSQECTHFGAVSDEADQVASVLQHVAEDRPDPSVVIYDKDMLRQRASPPSSTALRMASSLPDRADDVKCRRSRKFSARRLTAVDRLLPLYFSRLLLELVGEGVKRRFACVSVIAAANWRECAALARNPSISLTTHRPGTGGCVCATYWWCVLPAAGASPLVMPAIQVSLHPILRAT